MLFRVVFCSLSLSLSLSLLPSSHVLKTVVSFHYYFVLDHTSGTLGNFRAHE